MRARSPEAAGRTSRGRTKIGDVVFPVIAAPVFLWLLPWFTLNLSFLAAPAVVQIVLLGVSFGVMATLLRAFWTPSAFRAAIGGVAGRGHHYPELYGAFFVLGTFAMSVVNFAAATCVLRDHGVVGFLVAFPRDECIVRMQSHYLWHFVDTVPGLGVPGTLRWTDPYPYSDPVAGAFVLAFKIAIFLPVLAVFQRARRESPGN